MFDADLAVQQLRYVYSQAYMRLLQVLDMPSVLGRQQRYLQAQTVEVEKILAELNEVSRRFASRAIPKMYRQGIAMAVQPFAEAGMSTSLLPGFSGIHRTSVSVLSANFHDNMVDAHGFIGRRVRGQLRQLQLQTVMEKQAAGTVIDEAQLELKKRFVDEGLTAFRDRAGKEWRLDSYANMAVRTVAREATNQGLVNQLRGMGKNLVQITSHFGACEICAPLEGRVYSIDGSDSRFPPLSEAFGAYMTVHPNCKHSTQPYIEELDENPQGTQEHSNRPFEDDPRTAAEKAHYERTQREAAERLEQRKAEEQRKVEEG